MMLSLNISTKRILGNVGNFCGPEPMITTPFYCSSYLTKVSKRKDLPNIFIIKANDVTGIWMDKRNKIKDKGGLKYA